MSIARIAGAVYVVTFVAGTIALVSGNAIANAIAALSYVVVTLLFYVIFKRVSRPLSLAAALVSLGGIVDGALIGLRVLPASIHPLVFFGVYCLLIGYLIVRSTLLPRVLGVLMMFGGLGWLTFMSPSLARSLSPYNFAPGMIGEGALTLWLVVKGVRD